VSRHAKRDAEPTQDDGPRDARSSRAANLRAAGGKVKSRKQAIAIALNESGTSKYETRPRIRRTWRSRRRKEAKGETYQQETEGKSHVGARGKRESSRAMGGKDAKTPARRGRKKGTR